MSGRPVTAGTQRSSDQLHVDESHQGDNERLNDLPAQHVIVARDQTSLEPVMWRADARGMQRRFTKGERSSPK